MRNEDQDEYEQFLGESSCLVLRHLAYEDRCEFVEKQCDDEGELINYVNYVYCTLGPTNLFTEILCILHILTWCAVLFMLTTITADEFFCPPLKVLSTLLHMSEHLAGVTLLAIGNGSPDLFTTIVSLNDTDRLFYNDVAGGALLVIGLVAGTVCIVSPFKIIPSSFMKDVSFLLFGILLIDYAIGDAGIISRWHCIAIFSLYFIYISIVAIDQILVTQQISKKKEITKKYTLEQLKEIELLKSQAQMEMTVIRNKEKMTLNPHNNREFTRRRGLMANPFLYLLIDTAKFLNPIDLKEWSESSIYMRICTCIKSPFILCLRIFIPMCDYEIEGHGWCKLLNCIQIMLLPSSIMGFLFLDMEYAGIPIWAWTVILTTPFGIVLWIFTKSFVPPNCHWILAIYGCIGSTFVIYVCSNEVVEILNVIGITTGCHEAFLGCTILAVGNNLGDFVANIALARQGYQKMAFSACYGAPIFNAHISFGLILIINTFTKDDGNVTIKLGPLRDNISVFLTLTLLTTIFILISTDFYARKSVGYFLILVWSIFLLFSALAEAELIQTWRKEK